MATTNTVTELAHRLHEHFEQHIAFSDVFYTKTRWDALDQASRDEFVAVAQASLAGASTFNGRHIPDWVLALTTLPDEGSPSWP